MSESKLVTLHQYSGPLASLMLGLAALILACASGWALINGAFEAASFVAVSAQFTGLMAAIWGIQQRSAQRSGDGTTSTTTSTTATDGTATTTSTEVKP